MEAKARSVDRRARDLSANRITNFVLWRIPWVFIAVGGVARCERCDPGSRTRTIPRSGILVDSPHPRRPYRC